MSDSYQRIMTVVGAGFDVVGVAVIAAGALLAAVRGLVREHAEPNERYRRFRQDLGGAIVLGLEFLVAGDIIRSVVVAPSLENVMVLGLVVLIRTFLSFALQWELHGGWPWRDAALAGTHSAGRAASST
jgi:uncharacterized membrane protein